MFKIKFRRVVNVPGSYNGGGSFYYTHFLTEKEIKAMDQKGLLFYFLKSRYF